MNNSLVLSNARLVLGDQVVSGSIKVTDGRIAALDDGGVGSVGEDLQGDYLLPGLIELHTDHLETHYNPRPGVSWNKMAAIQAHDAQIASAGITTVFDCLRMGKDEGSGYAPGEMKALADAMADAGRQDRLRAEHFLHLRCEVSAPDVMESYADFQKDEKVKLVSLMDHAPGQRQFTDMAVYEMYYRGKDGMSEEAFRKFVGSRVAQSEKYSDTHRKQISADARARGITMASHDDATVAHIEEANGFGVRVAEFPTTKAAAVAANESGLGILMGAPNVVRGKSHSGNVAARDLAADKLLNLLSSDYVPSSLLHGAFVLSLELELLTLPEAVALVTANPARFSGFEDRGLLKQGLRADLIRVRYADDGVPTVKAVWREGRRVA